MAQFPTDTPQAVQGELFPLNIIRTETVLSRNPVHNLSTGKPIEIAIQVVDTAGKLAFQWQVSYNSRYGHPGRLAYKLDTLIVNRRIDEAGRPVPKVLRLGSLRDICTELGVNEGKATQDAKKALLQNASAFITAKLDYTGQDGSEQTFEFSDTRYGVIFTGQKLPDGRKASAVYLILHDTYRALLDRAPVRPLNYEYLLELPPLAQRFYELVSYSIYGAIRHTRANAKYLYSDFCTFAPQTRYYDWEHVRKQMYKLHKPHLDAQYLAKVEYEATTDTEGQPDWCFWYTPGTKAYAEYNGFLARKQPRRQPTEMHRPRKTPSTATPDMAGALPLGEPKEPAPSLVVDRELVAQLVANELNRGDAERLALEKPEECRRQLEYLPFAPEFKSTRGAYLRAAIDGGFSAPKGYAEHGRKERTRQRQADEAARKAARESHRKAHQAAYLAWVGERVGELENSQPQVATGFQEADGAERSKLLRLFPQKSPLLAATLQDFDRPETRVERLRKFLEKHRPEFRLPDFWEWDAEHNPASFNAESSVAP